MDKASSNSKYAGILVIIIIIIIIVVVVVVVVIISKAHGTADWAVPYFETLVKKF